MSDDLILVDDMMRYLDERRTASGLRGCWYRASDTYRVWYSRMREFPRQVRWGYQRVTRGWDDSAIWSLDTHLGEVLGAQLIALAECAHGYPDGYPFEQWTADLRRHGAALLAYGEDKFDTEELALYRPAQEAFRWVAENLGSLWD